jgi:hypothetical protein
MLAADFRTLLMPKLTAPQDSLGTRLDAHIASLHVDELVRDRLQPMCFFSREVCQAVCTVHVGERRLLMKEGSVG